MTLFTNGYITLPIPKGFQSINSTEEFVELVLVDPTKPMTIKVSVTPTPVSYTHLTLPTNSLV